VVPHPVTTDIKELFSVESDAYAAARPHYPRELFAQLVALCPATARAWDCGTGSGQAAVALAQWFEAVEATDVSAQQIAHAVPHPRVNYSVQPAEHTRFADESFDLITVAQALHWFEFDRFWPEVHRVLRPGGLFAAWAYSWPCVSETLDRIVAADLMQVIKDYWMPQNQIACEGYTSIPFPFQELEPPRVTMQLSWNLPQFIAYLSTWSATRRCREAEGPAFFDRFTRGLASAWGDPATTRAVTMEFFFRLGRHGAAPRSAVPH